MNSSFRPPARFRPPRWRRFRSTRSRHARPTAAIGRWPARHRSAGAGWCVGRGGSRTVAGTWHGADRGARGHDLLQHVQPAARWAPSSTSAPTCRASCATDRVLWNTCAKLGIGPAAPRPTAVHRGCECLGACADAPVMLVNDRQMVSFTSNERPTRGRHPQGPGQVSTTTMQMLDLSKFQGARVTATCFPRRHANPQIYAGLNGSNWRLKDYHEAAAATRRCARSGRPRAA